MAPASADPFCRSMPTAFVIADTSRTGLLRARIRFFACEGSEIPLCVHALLAAGWFLSRQRAGDKTGKIMFTPDTGGMERREVLEVDVTAAGMVELQLGARPARATGRF
jgi:predicted PhzF superfamily epimerase YddE/YHI9